MNEYALVEVTAVDLARKIQKEVLKGRASIALVAQVYEMTPERVRRITTSTPVPRSGFSGASAWEISMRFAVGELSEEQAVDQLGRWVYEDVPVSANGAGDAPPVEGTWADVAYALADGLITPAVYFGAERRRAR